MSNEEPEDRTPTDPVKNWGASDFYGIRIGDEVISLGVGEEPIDEDKAKDVITDRLVKAMATSGDAHHEVLYRTEAERLADLIVSSLPSDAMRPAVIDTLDLRPYAARFASSDAPSPGQERTWQRDEPTDMAARQALLSGLQLQAEQVVEDAIAQYNLPAAQREAAKNDILKFDEKAAGKSFEVVATERAAMFGQAAAGGQLPAGEAATNPMSPDWSPTTLVERQTQQAGIPVDELRQLANAGLMDLAGLVNEEIQLQSQLNTNDYLPVEIRTVGGPASAGSANTPTTQRMSMINAMTYLQTLPESKVAEMQQKLAAAGYFNELSTPRGYVEGDAFDDATIEAWNNVVMESIQRNVPITKLVGSRLQGYQERNRAKLEQQLLPIDEQYLKQAGDMAMQELVGRQLTVAESRQLVSYLDQLRSERAGYVQGGGAMNQGIDGPLRGDYGFDDSDINARIARLAAPEVAGQRGFDTAQKVWQAFDLGEIDTQALAQWRRDNRPASLGTEEY